MDDLIKNDIDELVKNKEAMIYLSKSPTLVSQLKSSPSYNDDIKEKILKSTVITEKEKYEAGLPCYLLKNYKEEDFFDEFKIFYAISGTVPNTQIASGVSTNKKIFRSSYLNSSMNIGSETKINLASYSEVKIEFDHYTDYIDNSLTGTFDFGIGSNLTDFLCTETKDFNNGNGSSQAQSSSLTLDVSSYNESYYIVAKLYHGAETEFNTVTVEVNNIALLN